MERGHVSGGALTGGVRDGDSSGDPCGPPKMSHAPHSVYCAQLRSFKAGLLLCSLRFLLLVPLTNALGRLLGTLLSGWLFQVAGEGSVGLQACLWASLVLLLLATVISARLPRYPRPA